jgi:hypothetical protein
MLNYKLNNWNQFRRTGLLAFVNSFLHAFGWTLTVEVDEDNIVMDAWPEQTKKRGFSPKSMSTMYSKLDRWLKSAEFRQTPIVTQETEHFED